MLDSNEVCDIFGPALIGTGTGLGNEVVMKQGIHPKYEAITVNCSCGNEFETSSTLAKNLNIEVCSQCHPFYTGKQKLVDTAGRVEKFMNRYKRDQGSAATKA